MKFQVVFFAYSCMLGALVGALAALFLWLVTFLIDVVWHVIPSYVTVSYYPLLAGVVGGILVGLLQKYMGNYPKTIHETLHEFQETKAVAYKNKLLPNFLMGTVVLAFGASLGPEGALASIVGGLITWVGDRMKLTMQQREQLVQLGIGAMLSSIFYAPLVGVSEGLEEKTNAQEKWKKVILYALATAFGIVAFSLVNKLVDKEKVFTLTMPDVAWSWQGIALIIPAIALGYIAGIFFLKSEKLFDGLAAKVQNKFWLAVVGGIAIGLFGCVSHYFLFSGEHELKTFSLEAASYSIVTVLLIGIGKIVLTNICFACGWRGGKIFPAIFASVAIGFALTNMFPYTPGLVIAVVVTTCCTVILGQPIVTAMLLIFLFPLQFAPFIIVVAFVVQRFRKAKGHSIDATTI